ncbi:hypothetical protein EI693_01805 [Pseudomonas oryziphila]|uniref:DUF1534 domain-containing protein n=1 Tax=Pseudomonas oryziphila TaxID=2894079 RepID=A0ABM7CKJ0_9PSED|nr:hypothetical protein EI693_01805 [Pseudomonas oryziphila]
MDGSTHHGRHCRCRSGLVPRKGREAAPVFSSATKIAGAAAQPFRDTRPLLQWMCKPTQWK